MAGKVVKKLRTQKIANRNRNRNRRRIIENRNRNRNRRRIIGARKQMLSVDFMADLGIKN